MTSNVYETSYPRGKKAFELKGEMSMLSVLRLFDTDTEHIAKELARKITQAPEFFRHMPIVIDLESLAKKDTPPVFTVLVGVLREHGLVPVGIRNGNESQTLAASQAGLALLQEHHVQKQHQIQNTNQDNSSARADAKVTNATPQNNRKSRMIMRPVRSGQQVYAPEGDLVLVAPASPGSELLADGCIHIYGALRGRALAGVNGDTSARIFCQSLDAELVAVAGHYQINEDLPPELREKPAQIWLDNERLTISPL